MSILPTTRQLAAWIAAPKGEALDTTAKVASLFEHVAHMAAVHAATVCHAAVADIDPLAPERKALYTIADLITEATQP